MHASARQGSLREAPLRYPGLLLSREERTAESLWTSLRYFNLYRVALATLFLSITLVYEEAFTLGSHALHLFRYVSVAYLVAAIGFQAVMHNVRDQFNLQLTLHVGLDIAAITLLMYASGGMRSGLGVMLLVSVTGAAIVAPRRLTFLYAALATIALLLEQ